MKYKLLGNSSLKVSELCLGTMTFGEQNTEKEAHEQLNFATERGINFIDTAELYAVPSTASNNGLTERYIGTWLKDQKRENIIISTKIAGPTDRLPYIRPNLNYGEDNLRSAVEGSLRRLRTDYIDIYHLHWPERSSNFFGKRGFKVDSKDKWKDNFESVLLSMQKLINEGKIRNMAVSNETPWGISRWLYESKVSDLPRIIAVQNPYNLLNRLFEVGLAEMSIREDVPLLAYSPLAFGLLTGKYHRNEDGPESRINKFDYLSRYNKRNCHLAVAKYHELALKFNTTLTAMSLAFIRSRPFIGSTIIGATNLDQLKENMDTVDTNLSLELINELEKIHEKIPNPGP